MFEIELPSRILRYDVRRKIAETDLSFVYEAALEDGSRCCLKVVKSKLADVPTADQIRFRTEATVLAQIKSPQVVQVLEVGEIQSHGFISLEWVEGRPLSALIRDKSLDQTQGIELISQVCLGLMAVHSKGLLHLDIKPDNIMIYQDDNGKLSAKIVDFGFAGSSGAEISGLMGTPRYIPPEQSGLVKWPVDVPADLYSLGVTLFEAITGRLPFDDPDPRIVLQEHLEKAPPSPREFNSEVHPLVEKIIAKLLAKSPHDRYQSALSLHSDLQVVLERIQKSNPSSDLELDSLSRQGLHLGKVFVGRKSELNFLFDLYQKASTEKIQLCFVSGVSGLGKTALLSELQNRVLISGANLAYGKCQQFSRGLPFFGVGEAFNSFLSKLETYPQASQDLIRKRIIDSVGELKADLIRVAPGFTKIFGEVQIGSAAADERAIQRMKEAIVRVISSIAHKGQPLLILIDDLQWADYSSIDLISYLADLQVGGAIYFIGTYRPEEVLDDHPLKKLLERHDGEGQVKKLELRPLTIEEASQMVARSLGQETRQIDESLVQLVIQRSRGNPFYINEIIRTLLKEGILRVTDGKIAYEKARAETIRLPDSLIEIVLARIQGLPENVQRLLSAAAIMGNPVLPQDLSMILASDPFEIEKEIRSLAADNIFRKIPDGYAFYHDKVLEACLLLFDAETRTRTHLNCIELLKSKPQNPTVVFALAEHAIRGSHPQYIVEFCTLAGEQAFFKNSLSDAFKYFSLVLENLDHADPKRLSIRLKICDISIAMGNYLVAEKSLKEILDDKSQPLKVRVSVNNKLAETLQRQGKYGDALERLNDSLAMINAPLNKSYFQIAIAIDRLMIFVLSRFKWRMASTERQETLALLCDVLRRLWMVMVIVDNNSMLHISYRFLRVAIQSGRPIDMATAHQYLALTVCNKPSPDFKAGLTHSQRAMDIGQSIGAHEIVAGALIRIAAFLTWQAKSREAFSYSERARETLLSVGNMWDLGNAIIFSYFSNRTLGKLNEALSSAQGLMRLGERTGSKGLVSSGSSKVADVLFLQGNVDEAEKSLDLAIQTAEKFNLKFDLFQALKVAGFSRLYRGQLQEARAYFAKAIKLNEEAKGSFFTAYVQEAYLGWVETHLKDKAFMDQLIRTDSSDFKTIKKYIVQAAEIEKHFREYALVLKLEALLAYRLGRLKEFHSKFDLCIKRYAQQERPIELAIAEFDYGTCLNELSDAQAKNFLRKAHNKFTELKVLPLKKATETALKQAGEHVESSEKSAGIRAEKVTQTLLDISVAALSSIDKEQQTRALLDKTLDLFQAERALLFLLDDSGELKFTMGRATSGLDIQQPENFSRTILSKVQSTKAPIVAASTDEGVLLGSHSVVAKNLLSMMAAPILIRGSFRGVLYIDNRIEKKLYMTEDGELLTAISSQIGTLMQMGQLASIEIQKRTIEKDLELTAAVQSLLLPEEKDFIFKDASIVTYYQPAHISGGDWWWHAVDSNGNLQIYMGDVSGHGPGSAMITALVAGAMRATNASRPKGTIRDVLQVTNNDLRKVAKGKYHMTMNVVVVHPESKLVSFWFAGGTPVIVLRRSGEMDVLVNQSSLLGSETDFFSSEELQFQVGDRILLCTDGVTEQTNSKGMQFGQRRLFKVLKDGRDKPIAEVRDQIVKAVDSFRESKPRGDDICLIMIELQ